MQFSISSALSAVLFLFLVSSPLPVASKGMLVERRHAMRGSGLTEGLEIALGEATGCGGAVSPEHLEELERQLYPIWNTLPKNGAGNVERRSLRYLVHRHFARQSSLQIRGFEPSRPVDASSWGDADILAQRVPVFVEAFLESSHKLERGFNLADTTRLVATVERLIFDFEGGLLQQAYATVSRTPRESLSRGGLDRLLENYLLLWMLGEDTESFDALRQDRNLLSQTIPHWEQIMDFARGEVQTLQFQRVQAPVAAFTAGAARPGHNALTPHFAFEDVHSIVGGITRSFASFWDSECRSMKAALVRMDTHHTGRVPLSKFYSHALETEWRFGESEEYLRDLGALDESSWLGKQVIIPNYIQATSNCIISSTHYLVCCTNDCESILEEIEVAIGAPTATPAQIVATVGNISTHTSGLEEEHVPDLQGSLLEQLRSIAEAHGGEVPLHGRLFAQWLHFVFPRECPFPHKTGAVATMTPAEFGERYYASAESMRAHADAQNGANLTSGVLKEDLQWMSQWSEEEELIVDYAALGLRAPWERHFGLSVVALLAGGFAVLALLGRRSPLALLWGSSRFQGGTLQALPFSSKAHFV